MELSSIDKQVLSVAMMKIVARRDDFPEDEWFTLNENYELNMFTTDSGEQIGTIYAVKNKVVDSQGFVRIYHEKPRNLGPVTQTQIEDNFETASQEEEEYKQFQREEDARMEAEWLASRENPFADRALDNIPDDVDLDDLDDKPLGYILSRQDPYGIYTPAGNRIGSTCKCEDYPCCGH